MTVIAPHQLDVTAPDFAPWGPDVAAARAACWRADTPVGPAVCATRTSPRYFVIGASVSAPPSSRNAGNDQPAQSVVAGALEIEDPGDDFVSQLVAAEEEGDRLSETELRNMVATTLFAGHDTTKHQVALALYTIAGEAASWDLLAAHPELAPAAVEEVMRVAPAVPAILRLALDDVLYRDLEIPAGTLVTLLVAAANGDPDAFGEARSTSRLGAPAS